MNPARYGVILNTGRYDQCVAFYRDLFGLTLMFEKQEGDFRLSCFDFGGGYLMIETGGTASDHGRTPAEGAAKLRFNVEDIGAAQRDLRARGIDAEIERNSWGATINIFDPDGNRVGIRDEISFKKQISR